MPDVDITVRGCAEFAQRPERATVRLAVDVEAATGAQAYAAASSTAAAITEQVAPMFDSEHGPVTWWVSDQVRTWSEPRWKGDTVPPVPAYHAGVEFQIRFGEFGALSRWLSEVAPLAGVRVHGIEWTLTEARQRELGEQARAAAVGDARDKANSYARNLGLGEPHVVAIADAGMLGHQPFDPGSAGPMRYAALSASGNSGISFTPQDVVVAVSVDARFRAT